MPAAWFLVAFQVSGSISIFWNLAAFLAEFSLIKKSLKFFDLVLFNIGLCCTLSITTFKKLPRHNDIEALAVCKRFGYLFNPLVMEKVDGSEKH